MLLANQGLGVPGRQELHTIVAEGFGAAEIRGF